MRRSPELVSASKKRSLHGDLSTLALANCSTSKALGNFLVSVHQFCTASSQSQHLPETSLSRSPKTPRSFPLALAPPLFCTISDVFVITLTILPRFDEPAWALGCFGMMRGSYWLFNDWAEFWVDWWAVVDEHVASPAIAATVRPPYGRPRRTSSHVRMENEIPVITDGSRKIPGRLTSTSLR